ncbi:MAG: UPF0262 family protein [Rickettsiales bacterium]|nr:UPF0262 family protein [Rickettsiales bacterium]
MTERITRITLDDISMGHKRSAEAVHERNVAIADLLDENVFEPKCMHNGPYDVHLSVVEGKLVMDVASADGKDKAKVILSIAPLRGLIRDYFMICESYYEALTMNMPHKLEAIDMGRRGIHNEGSEAVMNLLKERIHIDFCTARRLFTLVCVLHIK